ncbi:MAG: FMN-binding protein [Ilumatobacteraceae bacterium]
MSNSRKPQRPQQPIDPLLQQRLQQLGSRRPNAPLPPPAPGTQQRAAAQQRTVQPAGVSSDAAARIAALAAARGNAKPGANSSAKTGKRAKPARAAKLASLALSAVTTLGLAGLFANQDGASDSIQLTNGTVGAPLITVAPTASTVAAPATTVAAPPVAEATATTVPVAEQATTVATEAPTTVAAAPAGVADGTYVGGSDRNRFGTVQVQVVYSGGQITDVQILQYPDGDRRSVRINESALPMLISEALGAQSADVSTISGATYTSRSYRASLQSAIDAAKSASGITG